MLFETPRYVIREAVPMDATGLADIYRSNPVFLETHLPGVCITPRWVQVEQEEMGRAGFVCAVIEEKETQEVAGLLEYHPGEETCLSLMLLDGTRQHQEAGQEILCAFESYAAKSGSTSIRVEVVTGNSDTALDFWKAAGFEPVEEITLEWVGRKNPALRMRRTLCEDRA